jgi:hypothetical protein
MSPSPPFADCADMHQIHIHSKAAPQQQQIDLMPLRQPAGRPTRETFYSLDALAPPGFPQLVKSDD